MPGWYPDPAGERGRYRFWDGSQWSATTTADPRDAPPSQAGAGGGRPAGPRSRRPVIIALAVILVLVIVGIFAVGAIFDRGTVTSDPVPPSSAPVGDQTSEPSAPESSEVAPSAVPSVSATPSPGATATGPTGSGPSEGGSSSPRQTVCPAGDPTLRQPPHTDTRIHGGDLSFRAQAGYTTDGPSDALYWAYDVGSQSRMVDAHWSSSFAVGALSTVAGFEEPASAAALVMACTAPSALYTGFTGRRDVYAKAITVDGHPAFAVRSEIHVDNPQTTVAGDTVEVVVVDTDSAESLGMFWACVPLGDADALAQLDQAVKTLRVG